MLYGFEFMKMFKRVRAAQYYGWDKTVHFVRCEGAKPVIGWFEQVAVVVGICAYG